MPYVTILTLVACGWVLVASGGIKEGLTLPVLLAYGAKATPLILDRGETWRLFAANFLHKDILHFAFNAFAIWNVGGALERAVRPADYLALLIYTALGTTLVSAVGADSISLGASGIAFGMLGASATFGWRRGVRGQLRSYFGLRIVPWMLALFAAGVGSSGVDNWGHAGGLVFGAAMGCFLTPRSWPGDASARRVAAALGALLGTLALGVVARPMLPLLGGLRDGSGVSVAMPLGWRRSSSELHERMVYSNGLTSTFRSSATVVQTLPCPGRACDCDQLVRTLIEDDIWRTADLGPLKKLQLEDPAEVAGLGTRIDGTLTAEDGPAQVNAICLKRPAGPLAIVVLQPPGGSTTLATRMASSIR
ncbi:MAG TPA: rhomboid family intramembrane serine protease [Myxococcales bacterium]|nr:rhomboid family intramembrane serine protease [Myxococcales bacterium]